MSKDKNEDSSSGLQIRMARQPNLEWMTFQKSQVFLGLEFNKLKEMMAKQKA